MGAIKGPIFRGQLQDIFLKVSFTCFKHVDYRVETHCKEDANLWELHVPAWGENVARRSRIFWILEQFSRAGKKKVKYLCSKVLNVVSFIQAKDFAESRQINLIFKLNVYIRYYTLSRMKNHCYLFCRCSDIKKIEKNPSLVIIEFLALVLQKPAMIFIDAFLHFQYSYLSFFDLQFYK